MQVTPSSLETQLRPHVNSALLPHWVGKAVNLPCRTAKFHDNGSLTVAAADGGHVSVRVIKVDEPALAQTYIDITGKVLNATAIQILAVRGMGFDLDMKLLNDTISIIHGERFPKNQDVQVLDVSDPYCTAAQLHRSTAPTSPHTTAIAPNHTGTTL
ncbi:hypothetical protein FA15DRAFT_602098 [Coprinopsis marcescibilis]|uniref:Uncharacterized protein n=1 Tax=Coprinopsis marcescibilis TaxID=230819 RepID=A0A5C3KH12_COPMA|nr:hypothetical protein FA15DRAFT_602098 [Coprinopsis marcescibilis]